MTTIGQIAGIDHGAATRLRKAGIRTAEGLLERLNSPERVQALSQKTGIDRQELMDMATSVDLMRLEGMGGRYSALLRAAGIRSLDDLASCSAPDALQALAAANHEHRIVRRLPSSVTVNAWIQAASGQIDFPSG